MFFGAPTRIALLNRIFHLNNVDRIVHAWTKTSIKSRYLPGFPLPGHSKKILKDNYCLIHISLS